MGIAGRGQLCNISVSGAYIISALPVALLARVRIQMKGPPMSRRLKESLEGQVIRSDRRGFAVEWSEFAPPLARALIKSIGPENLNTMQAATLQSRRSR
jgi:hypothetical protein